MDSKTGLKGDGMKKKQISLIVWLWMGLFFTGGATGRQPEAKPPLRMITVEGSAYERGVQHGQQLKNDIRTLVGLWKADLGQTYQIDPDVFIRRFLDNTDFPSAVKRWTPDLIDEIKGISDASGIDFDTLFAFQLVDEMWVLGRSIVSGDHCTSIGIKKDGGAPGLIAQNLDIPVFYHGFQTLIHSKDPDSGLETYLFTFPGFIAANGLNSRSVGVVVNAVQQLASSRDGLPVAFVIRGILQAGGFPEAVKFIQGVTHGAPQNYIIGGIEGLGSFECAVDHVEEYLPFPDAPFTYHTNHPLRNRHYSREMLDAFQSKGIDPDQHTFPCRRFAALQEIFSGSRKNPGLQEIKDIFADRTTHINNNGSFGCTIMILKPEPELHLSPGRPDEDAFLVFRFGETPLLQPRAGK